MNTPSILAFKGISSQTGLAVKEEFPIANIVGDKESFNDIAEILQSKVILAVLPMWNSHEGEIIKARVLELIFGKKARLYRMWPKPIQFECLSRSKGSIRTVISVSVAAAQCSQFVSQIGARFIEAASTVDAYEKFKTDTAIDAVLCTPEQNKDGFTVVKTNAANPLNFTTFVLLGENTTERWLEEDWGALYAELKPAQGVYFGVEMPIRTFSSSEDQESFLDTLTSDATNVEDIPRVLFVAKRKVGLCGLLIEAQQGILTHDILTEEGYSEEITVIPNIGEVNSPYPLRIKDRVGHIYQEHITHDFIRHRGRQTCFYAVPSLDIITHGFEEEIVEPVVKQIVNKYFELYDRSAIACTPTQRAFFEKHKSQYYQHGKDFIEFKDIGLE